MADEKKKEAQDGPSELARRNVKLALLDLLSNDPDVKTEFAAFVSQSVEEFMTSNDARPASSPQLTALDAAAGADVVRLIEEKLRQHLRPEVFRKPI